MSTRLIRARAEAFARDYGMRVPVLLAPMAGACPVALSIAVVKAGGMGSAGVLLMQPDAISTWAAEFREASGGPFALNLWIPDPAPRRDEAGERAIRDFLAEWGPEVPASAASATPPDFAAQCETMLAVAPPVISSVMGLYEASFVSRMKAKGIRWFAVVSTVGEARAAEEAGADVVVAQGMEAGGHRAAFDANTAQAKMAGLFSLIPAVVDAVKVPVVATGGIADARGVAAALMLGASAVQIGTGFLRCPEAGIACAWADAIGRARPEDTLVSRVFSGRPGRSIVTGYVRAATAPDAPWPAPYPVQRALTKAMRDMGTKSNDIDRIQAWSGQSAALASTRPAGELVRAVWEGALDLLG